MIDIQRLQQLRQVAKQPSESDYVQALTTILTELEYRQLEAVDDLHDALEIDGIDVRGDRDQRQEQLLELADAIASGDLEEWWCETIAADHVEDPEAVRPYLGMSDEDWQEQIETWADTYRDMAGTDVADLEDREIAEKHVEDQHGITLEEFEEEIVGYDRRECLRQVLAGNFEAVEAGIDAATATVEGGDQA